jgi:hypothetical protein
MRMQDERVTKQARTGHRASRRHRLEDPEGDGYIRWTGKLKANSHMPCRAHAVPMPFPYHAVPH